MIRYGESAGGALIVCFGVTSTFFVVLGISTPSFSQVVVGPQVLIDVGGGPAASNETSIASSNFNPNKLEKFQ